MEYGVEVESIKIFGIAADATILVDTVASARCKIGPTHQHCTGTLRQWGGESDLPELSLMIS
jgi:hypothetical protein